MRDKTEVKKAEVVEFSFDFVNHGQVVERKLAPATRALLGLRDK